MLENAGEDRVLLEIVAEAAIPPLIPENVIASSPNVRPYSEDNSYPVYERVVLSAAILPAVSVIVTEPFN